jgi:hypothetical protein
MQDLHPLCITSSSENYATMGQVHLFTSSKWVDDTNYALVPAWTNRSRYKIDFTLKFPETKALKRIMWGRTKNRIRK